MLSYKYVLVVFLLLNLMDNLVSRPQEDPERVTNFTMFKPKLPTIEGDPKCAVEGITFCEHVDSYPYNYLKFILERNPVYKNLFVTDELEPELANRIIDDRHFVCKSFTKLIYPKIGKNNNNEWKYIINHDDFMQSVRVEMCRRVGGPCDIIGEVPEGYVTTCKQKYLYSRLLSLNDEGLPTTDIFQIPSTCCCSYKRSLSFFVNDVEFLPASY